MPGIKTFRAGSLSAILALGTLLVGAGTASAATLTQKAQRCTGGPVSHVSGAAQTIEVLLPDGSSVLIAPGSDVSVTCGAQGVSVQVGRGLARVAGSAASAGAPVRIRTADAELDLDSGAAVVSVSPAGTRAHLLGGRGLTVRGGDRAERLYRPAFEVTVRDGSISAPRRMSADEVLSDFTDLSPGLTSRVSPDLRGDARPAAPARRAAPTASEDAGTDTADAADTSAPADELGDVDLAEDAAPAEGDVVAALPENNLSVFGNTPTFRLPGGSGGGGGGVEITVPTLTFTAADFDAALGTVDLALGASPTLGNAVGSVAESNTSVIDGNFIRRLQETVKGQDSESQFANYDQMTRRALGPTTNSILGSLTLTETDAVRPEFGAASGGLSYFAGSSVFGLKLASAEPLSDEQGLFLFDLINSATGTGGVDPTGLIPNSIFTAASFRRDFTRFKSDTTFGRAVDTGTGGIENVIEAGRGALLAGMNYGNPLSDCGFVCLSQDDRQPDNFVLFDILPADALQILCGAGVDCTALIQTLAEAERVANGADEYFYLVDPFSGDAAALIPDPTDPTRLIFGAGDLDGLAFNPVQGASLDTFHLSPGMLADFSGGLAGLPDGMDMTFGQRAFLRGDTWTTLDQTDTFGLGLEDLSQTGLFVLHPDGNLLGAANGGSKLLHLDYGLRTDPDGVSQISTMALTLGNVTYRANPANSAEVDALVAAQTIGTARGLTLAGTSESAVFYTGALQSTSAGGGNPNLPGAGHLGFFVLENSGQTFDDIAGGGTLTAGSELPLGVDPVPGDDSADDERFSLLRLATGVTTTAAPVRTGIPGTLTGYVAGFTDNETSAGTVQLGTLARSDRAPQLTFTGFDTASNSLTGQIALDGQTVTIGGPGGLSAYLDDARYAARSSGAARVAIVSGDLAPGLLAGAPGGGAPAANAYQHLQWGYFIGDLATTEGSRRHVQLGSYAAAEQIDNAAWQSWLSGAPSGEIVYQGHMLGNVQSAGNVYTATGTFRDSFDFTRRAGTATATFDGRTLSGASSVSALSPAYTATLGPSGNAAMGAGAVFSGQMNGRFGALPAGGGAPHALVGSFTIQNQATSPSTAYRAAGTFGAER